MSNFLSGYKFLVIPHPDGIYDKEMVIELYSSIIESVDIKQEQKVENDYRQLYCLDDARYYVALRERVGVQSEHERVRIDNVSGLLYPSFVSQFTMWDKLAAKDWQEIIKQVTNDGGEEEITEMTV